jgi:hypothetical protein
MSCLVYSFVVFTLAQLYPVFVLFCLAFVFSSRLFTHTQMRWSMQNAPLLVFCSLASAVPFVLILGHALSSLVWASLLNGLPCRYHVFVLSYLIFSCGCLVLFFLVLVWFGLLCCLILSLLVSSCVVVLS